jgi:serine/threonine protein kinase
MNRLPSYDQLPVGFLMDDRFMILRRIGSGASSFVYHARDQKTATEVAIKLLNPFLQRDRVTVDRFRREMLICRSIDHPQIVKVFDFCETERLCYLVMEHCEGIDLLRLLEKEGTMPFSMFLSIARQVSELLARCHDAGVIHRDLKPSNMILSPSGLIRLVDFGIAKLTTMSDLTKTGTSLGTPQYMAPELFLGERPDPRADIYSLGVVFFELLTGQTPYGADLIRILSPAHRSTKIPSVLEMNPTVPAWIDQVITLMLQWDPNHRYQGMAELLFDLTHEEEAIKARRSSAPTGTCLFCHHPLLAGLPFCGYCGTSFLEAGSPGRYSLILYETSIPNGIAAHLATLLPSLNKAALSNALKKPPRIIVKNVNEKTGLMLFNDLNLFPSTLDLVNSLPRRFALPSIVSATAMGLSILTAIGIKLSALNTTGWVIHLLPFLIILAMLLWYFVRATVPLIPRRVIRKTAEIPWTQDQLRSYQKQIKTIKDPGHKALLASLLARSLQVGRSGNDHKTDKDPDPFSIAVETAFDLVSQIEEMELFLSSTTLNTLQEKIKMLERRIATETDPYPLASLINQKVALLNTQKEYCDVQDQFERCYHQLLGLSSRINLMATKLSLGRFAEVQSDLTGLIDIKNQ